VFDDGVDGDDDTFVRVLVVVGDDDTFDRVLVFAAFPLTLVRVGVEFVVVVLRLLSVALVLVVAARV